MIKKKAQFRKCNGCWLLLPVVLLVANTSVNATERKLSYELQDKLAAEVKDFENQGKPLIPTLLEVADRYDLPMGIEKVEREALDQPITIKLKHGSVAKLLDRCIRQRPGYSWAARDGVVLIYGDDELKKASNLFNFIIPVFEAENETLNRYDNGLRLKLYLEKEKPGGYVGSFPGSNEFENKRLSIKMHNASVRQILNRLVALHGGVVWIARVPPEKLSQIPQAGLWALLPRSVRNPKGLLDELLRQNAGQK
jgi:hypothetical protein